MQMASKMCIACPSVTVKECGYGYLDVSDGIRIGGTAFNIMFPARVSASILDSPQWDTTYWLRHNETSFVRSKSYVPILDL